MQFVHMTPFLYMKQCARHILPELLGQNTCWINDAQAAAHVVFPDWELTGEPGAALPPCHFTPMRVCRRGQQEKQSHAHPFATFANVACGATFHAETVYFQDWGLKFAYQPYM